MSELNKINPLTTHYTLNANGRTLHLNQPVIMGILNRTPDSFSDGGSYIHLDKAIDHAANMIKAGAKIIDIGGESTRPGAAEVSVEEELARVIPLVQAIRERFDIWISVDTSKAQVIKEAAQVGMDIINDIRSLQEPDALEVASQTNLPVCIMHMQGQPKTMQHQPVYHQHVAKEVYQFFEHHIKRCLQAGIRSENLILDPGFGFGKSIEHNYQLLNELESFQSLNHPLLVGVSRKTMLYKLLDVAPTQCTTASVTAATLAMMKGAHILRVHDVAQTSEAFKIVEALNQYKQEL